MTVKDVADVSAGVGAIGSLLQWLPTAAAVLAIIWTLIRLYEWFRVRILKYPQDAKF